MSPDKREGIGAYVFSGEINDGLYTDLAVVKIGVRPVVNLKSNVEITSGDGTEGNPYIIK